MFLNPSGRPAGSKNKVQRGIKKQFEERADDLTEAVLALAEAGDGTALKIVFDRIYPAPKDNTVEIKLPKIKDSQSLRKASQVIIDALSKGNITPLEADKLTGIIEKHGKVIELEEMQKQIDEMKERMGSK